jgi:hypothetical protein
VLRWRWKDLTGLSIIDTMATKDDLVDLRTEIKGGIASRRR